jgi:hypothetical protein
LLHLSATVLLKNGDRFDVENLKLYPDSSINIDTTASLEKYIPVNKLHAVTYNKRWLGATIGLGIGIVLGFLSYPLVSSSDNRPTKPSAPLLFPVIETLLRGVIGWIVGYGYSYQFNP